MGLWGFLASCHNLVCSRLGKDSCLRKQDGQKQLRSPSACHMGTHKHPPQRVYTHGSVHTQPPTDTNTLYLEKEKKKKHESITEEVLEAENVHKKQESVAIWHLK